MKIFGEKICFRSIRSGGLNPLRRPKFTLNLASILIFAASLIFATVLPAGALDFTIDSLSDYCNSTSNGLCDTPYGCTLAEAIMEIDQVNDPSSIISFDASLSGTIVLTHSPHIISKNVTISGPGSDKLTIDGQNLYPIFTIDSNTNDRAVSISDLRLIRGKASHNGSAAGVYAGDSLTLTRVVVEGNDAGAGAVYCNACGGLTISYARFSNNTGTYGGGVYANDAAINISHSLFEGNVSSGTGGGGGMYVYGGTGTIADSVFENNYGVWHGGGLYFVGVAGGTLTIRDTRFAGNVSDHAGGGISLWTAGSYIFERITVAGNTAASGGGGISIQTGVSVSMVNSTISGNTTILGGGGISANSDLHLANVTITGNTAETSPGGGILHTSGAVSVQNSIIAGNMTLNPSNSSSSDCYSSSSVTSGGYNVIGNGDGCTFSGCTGDQVGTTASPIDALLGPLAWNGGATPTHALLVTKDTASPALEHGNPLGCTWDDDADGGATPEVTLSEDQRTAIRPYDADGGLSAAICDVGSYEWSHCDNGIMDNHETGIDCGGSCVPCDCGFKPPAAKIIGSAYSYSTIQAAYDDARTWDSAILKARDTNTAEDLTFDRAIYSTLRGGYDCDFFRIRGMTTVASLTVSAGRLTVENVAIGGP